MQQRTSGALYWWALGLISLVGLSLRLWNLGEIGIWGDEVFGAREAINLYHGDIVPSFEGLLGHLGVLLGLLASGADLQSVEPGDFGALRAAGVTPFALRVVPAIIGSLTVPVAAIMSRRLLGTRQSLVLAVLLAIAPWHLYWSQGARFYATQFFFYVIAYILYFEATEDQSLKKLALAMFFFVCAFNAQYTSLVFVFIIAADWLISRITYSPVHLSAGSFVIIGFAVACCVAMPVFLMLGSDTYAASHFAVTGNPPWYIAVSIIAFVHPVVVLTALVSGMMKGALPTRNRIYLLLGALVPILVMSTLSFRSYSGSRYGLVCLYPMLALSAAGLVHLYDVIAPKVGRFAAALPLLLVLGTYLLSDVNYFKLEHGFRPRWSTAAELVRAQYQSGEKVAVGLHHLGLYLLDDLGDDVVIPIYDVGSQNAGVWVITTREDSEWLLERSVIKREDYLRTLTTYYFFPRHQIDVWYRAPTTALRAPPAAGFDWYGAESRIPDWVVYPGAEWTWLDAEQAGLHSDRWAKYVATRPTPGGCGGDIHTEGRWGTCVQRGGHMLHCWGDPDYTFNSASLGKAFNGFVLQLAIDRGLVTGDERVCAVWPECPSDCGPASTLRNLFHMRGGFDVSNGFLDGCDNTRCGGEYSSGGQWRLNQTLTHVLDENLKDFLDRELFRHIGIDAEDWYWLSGRDVHANKAPPNAAPEQEVLYPDYTGKDRWYGCFVDPPYVVRGHDVVGGGGWVGMSPKDLARVGLLLASNGTWAGRKLISKTNLVDGHEGCGGSDLHARGGDSMFAWGRVATLGIEFPDDSLIAGPMKTPSGGKNP